MGELAKPFKLAVTLAHPSLSVDVKQTAIEAGKAVGGFMLLGPIGLGAALAGESSSETQLCSLEGEAAQKGVKLNFVEKKGSAGKTIEGVEKGLGGMEKKLKGLIQR